MQWVEKSLLRWSSGFLIADVPWNHSCHSWSLDDGFWWDSCPDPFLRIQTRISSCAWMLSCSSLYPVALPYKMACHFIGQIAIMNTTLSICAAKIQSSHWFPHTTRNAVRPVSQLLSAVRYSFSALPLRMRSISLDFSKKMRPVTSKTVWLEERRSIPSLIPPNRTYCSTFGSKHSHVIPWRRILSLRAEA